MITTNDINSILGIKEAFQLHGALKSVLFDKSKREEIFNKFLEFAIFKTKIKSNTTKSGITFLIYKKIKIFSLFCFDY